MIRFATAAAACLLACSTTSVLAASQSMATMSGLSFTLIDLNPRDGIAPSFSFLSSAGSTLMSISATDNALGEADSATRKRAGTFSFTNQMLADLTNTSASAQVSSTSLTAAGSAHGPSTSYSASASTGAVMNDMGYYPNVLNLSLSANTLLLIEASVSLSASATNPSSNCDYYYYCNGSEAASATASMRLTYNYANNGTSASVNDNKTVTLQANARKGETSFNWVYDPYYGYRPVYTTSPDVEESKSLNDVLTTVFTNSSSASQMASLGLSVSASGYGTTAPIPEPETYALALAGLGVAGLMARRRRSN